MTRYVAFATKGIEDVAAGELAEALDQPLPKLQVAAKHIRFATADDADVGILQLVQRLTTVDDVCLLVAEATDVSTADGLRAILADLSPAVDRLRALRPLDRTFSVTVTAARSPVGSSAAIATITAETVGRQLGWQPLEGARAPVDVRVFADGTNALVGVRLLDRSLSDRSYRMAHRKGALRPTVAAAMVRLACPDRPGHLVWDPFCGSGTILAEAHLAGHTVFGSDLDPDAVAATLANLGSLAPHDLGSRPVATDRIRLADAASAATWHQHVTVDTVVTNLPWGKQVSIQAASAMYAQVGLGVAILAARGGYACLLTTEPDRLAAAIRRAGPDLPVTRRRVGLLGQVPTLLTVGRRG